MWRSSEGGGKREVYILNHHIPLSTNPKQRHLWKQERDCYWIGEKEMPLAPIHQAVVEGNFGGAKIDSTGLCTVREED